MKKRKKSEVQFAYHSYAMGMVDVAKLVHVEVLNNLLIHRRIALQNSFSCSLTLLKVHYDIGTSSYKIIPVDHNNPPPMKRLFTSIVLLMLLASCSSSPHWYTYKKTGTGRYGYMMSGWPAVQSCAGMNHRNPVKNATVRRYHWTPKHVKQ